MCQNGGIVFPIRNDSKYICNMAKVAITSYPKEKIRIVFLESISDVAARNFKENGYTQIEKFGKAWSEEELLREIPSIHIPWLNW